MFGRNVTEQRERREQRERDKEANLRGLMTTRARPHTSGAAVLTAAPKTQRAKSGTRAEQEHKDALAQLGCMVCRRLFPYLAPGPVELHHLRSGGWGKGDYQTLIPLCPAHHRGDNGVHGLGTKGFAKHYGFDQAELLLDALTLLEKT